MQKKETPTLVELLKARDEKAFTAFYQAYYDYLFRLAMRFLKNPMDAEEVVQDVFITLLERIDEFREEASIQTWLYRITVNSSLMKLRKNKRQNHLSFEDEILQIERDLPASVQANLGDWARLCKCTRSPLEEVFLKELWEKIEKTGEEMGKARWQAFYLRTFIGLSEKELMQELGIGISALKSRLHRSRKFLRQKMKTLEQLAL